MNLVLLGLFTATISLSVGISCALTNGMIPRFFSHSVLYFLFFYLMIMLVSEGVRAAFANVHIGTCDGQDT